MSATDNVESRHWHLDRKVPIALIIMLAMQLVTAIWFFSSLEHRVTALESVTANSTQMLERTVKIETRVENMKDILTRIEQKLDAAPP